MDVANPVANSSVEEKVELPGRDSSPRWLSVLGVFFCVYLLLIAVGVIGDGFNWLAGGKEGAERIFGFATDPVVGLMAGMLATALIQSSSTVTSVIVGLVAGGLPVGIAIPMVMGANMGTTITNTIVSLGHLGRGDEFRRAFAAATIHDFFNLLSFVIFLPLEMAFGFLERLSGLLVGGFQAPGGSTELGFFNPIRWATDPIIDALGREGLAGFLGPVGPFLMIIGGIALIFATIVAISKLLKKVLIGTAEKLFHRAIGRGPLAGIFSGTLITFVVQSSTTTTSLAVPLAGSGVLQLKQVYPFTLGANIGTTLTALMAAFAVSPDEFAFALQIAVVHFLYNLIGVALIYGIAFLRNIPLFCAQKLADLATRQKAYALGYLLLVFFVLPGCIWLVFGQS